MSKNNIIELGKKTQFSSTNQPLNSGRKPKSFKMFNNMMKESGVEPLSKEALIQCYSFLFSATQAQIKKVADDEEQPLGLRLIIQEFTEERTRSKAMQDYRDYMFGKALQTVEEKSEVSIVWKEEKTYEVKHKADTGN